MRCEHCKAVMPDGAAFCPVCGRPQTFTRSRIDAAAAGDQGALTDLYNRTYNAVYNTIRFMVKDEDAALDILQDSYIKAFDSLGQLQEASKFEPWVKRIAHNKAIDYLRLEKPVTFSSLSEEDSDEAPQFEDDRPENLPEVVIDRQETTRLINEILDSLPEEQRVCISLFYYDQFSVKEIAAELGITEATVKSRLLYGRKKVETQVRDLEKKGTKLYGLAPIPLLMLLLQGQDLIGRAPSQTILQNVLAGSSGQAAAAGSAAEMAGQAAEAAQAAGSAAEAAAGGAQAAQAASAAQMAAAATHTAAGAAVKTAVYGTGKALAVKIIAAVAAVAVVAGGTVAAVHHFRNSGGNGSDTVVTQPASSKAAETLPAPTEPAPTIPERPTEAPRPTAPPVPETPPMPTIPTEPETEESTEALSWGEAYQEVLEICRKDLQGDFSIDQSILPRYKDFFTGTEANLSNEFQYAVRDVNGDGTPELILAAYAFPELEKERGCLVFEVFTFDGTQAVPLFWNVRESLYRLEQVYVSENGTLWCTSGNSGHNPTYVFELPPGGTALKQTVFLDPIDGTNDFRVFVDGKQTGTMTMHEFWHEWIPVDAVLEYHEIWEDLQISY